MEAPPPPGVSAIGTDGRKTIKVAAAETEAPAEVQASRTAAKSGAPKPRRPGEDVLVDPAKGRKVNLGTPTGVRGIESDVIEMPMPRQRLPSVGTASFRSVDGEVYSFRTRDSKGKPLPQRNEMCLFIALVEVAKGGSPIPVLEAFKLNIDDANGTKYFPIPEDVFARLGDAIQTARDLGEADEAAPDFRLGD